MGEHIYIERHRYDGPRHDCEWCGRRGRLFTYAVTGAGPSVPGTKPFCTVDCWNAYYEFPGASQLRVHTVR